ncbi:MAG TPA: SufE family protein [Bacteroidales bacterium]|jgi:cysteine desulfuration protein SufE|nr:SufE family protein [Bacteroidales bacterium]MDD4234480.1 SufE family protein [Bacteroidales bacterium]MDY0159714.1 SufE family protein [Bacteroidales bacterium]HRW20503.1 SufE family protein [Bacteroidales bacterium]HXK80643.1 SufE family protein [Bacteroidales bacterium]
MSIKDIQEQIIEEFSIFDDWMDKYAYLIEIGNELEPLDETKKTDSNLIDGCQSKVWIDAYLNNGKLYFEADSDAIITKGIASLLIKVLSGHTPEDIVNAELFFIEKIGLQQHLSPTRSNGLLSMIKRIKLYAMAYNSKNIN